MRPKGSARMQGLARLEQAIGSMCVPSHRCLQRYKIALFEEDENSAGGQRQDGGGGQEAVRLVDVLHEGARRHRVTRQPERFGRHTLH